MSDKTTEIKITGDASGVEDAMARAKGAVKSGAESIKNDSENMSNASQSMADRLKAAFEKMSASTAEASQKFSHHMKEMAEQSKEHTETIEGTLKKMNRTMKLFSEVMVAGAVGEAFIELAEKTGEFGEQAEHTAAKTGMTIESVQKYQFAAHMAGVESDDLTQSLIKLSKNMSNVKDDSSPMAEAFKKIGLSAKELDGMKIDDVLGRIADRFAETEDGPNKAAVAVELFGRAGAQMIPMLDKGSAGLEELKQKASDLGIVIDDSGVKQAAALGEQMKEMTAVNSAASVQIGLSLTPAFMSISKAFEANLASGGAFKKFTEGLGTTLTFVAEITSHVAQGFQEMGNIIAAGAAEVVAVLDGDFKMADQIEADFRQKMQDMAASYEKFREDLHKPLKIPEPESEGGKKKDIGSLGGEQKSESKMKEYDAQFAEKKAAIAKEEDADGNHRQMTLSEEAEFWQARLSLCKAGTEDYLSITQKLSTITVDQTKRDFESKLASLKAEEAAEKGHGAKLIEIADEEMRAIAAYYGKDSAQYQEAQKHKTETVIAESMKQTEAEIAALEKSTRAQITNIDAQIDAVKEAAKKGEISKNQEAELEANYLRDSLKLQQAALNQEMAIYAANPNHDENKLRAMYDSMENITAQGLKAINKAEAQSVSSSEVLYGDLRNNMNNLVSKGFDDMLNHTMTWRKATEGILTALGSSFKQFAVKQAEDWLDQEVLKTGYTEVQTAIRNGMVAAGLVTTKAVETPAAIGEITSAAGVAGANAFASTAAIPMVGLALAPAAAATAVASTLSFTSMAGFATGAWHIPSDGITKVHQGETILNASDSENFRQAKMGGGGSAIHLHVNAVDAHSVKKLFNDHGATLAAVLKRQQGKFAL